MTASAAVNKCSPPVFRSALVFPENQDHCQQAHARGDDDEGENESPA